MEKFNDITDEQLGAYLDGVLSESEQNEIKSFIDIDGQELLAAASRGLGEFVKTSKINLPSWNDRKTIDIDWHSNSDIAMCGFLGDETEESDDDAHINNDSED